MPGDYADKQISCVDCGTEFTFSADQQAHFAQLGFTNEPKRCGPCRAAKKAQSGGGGSRGPGNRGGGGGGPREMHSAVCAECGQPTQVPFKPTGGRPVFCSSCFQNQKR